MRGLWRLRTGLPGRSDLLRGRRARSVEGLLPGKCRVLRGSRLARGGRQGREDQQGPLGRLGSAPPGRREVTPAAGLPRFPWDSLAPYREKARAHPGGIVDLSVGTPVDPVPQVVRDTLAAAADAPGYPVT